MRKKVAVVILNWNGKKWLEKFIIFSTAVWGSAKLIVLPFCFNGFEENQEIKSRFYALEL